MNSRLPESLALEGFPTGGRPPNPELEDCRRVLTTSRGHVRMAPVVPPILKRRKTDRFMDEDQKVCYCKTIHLYATFTFFISSNLISDILFITLNIQLFVLSKKLLF